MRQGLGRQIDRLADHSSQPSVRMDHVRSVFSNDEVILPSTNLGKQDIASLDCPLIGDETALGRAFNPRTRI